MYVFDSLTGAQTDYRYKTANAPIHREVSVAQLISESAYKLVRTVERTFRIH